MQDIGREMRLPDEDVRKLRDLGYLHDIAEIALDGGLLNMNRPLTETRWVKIKRHPTIGYRILNDPQKKSGMIPEKAIQVMKDCSGTQFDPQVIEAVGNVLTQRDEKGA